MGQVNGQTGYISDILNESESAQDKGGVRTKVDKFQQQVKTKGNLAVGRLAIDGKSKKGWCEQRRHFIMVQ
jgi:hypothetical protein